MEEIERVFSKKSSAVICEDGNQYPSNRCLCTLSFLYDYTWGQGSPLKGGIVEVKNVIWMFFSKRVGLKLLTLREIICNKYKYKKCKKGIILHVIYVFKYIIKYGIVFDKIKASGHVTSPYPWYLVVLKLMPKWRIYHAFLRLKSLSLILAKTFRDDFLKCIEPKREFIDPW